MNKKLTVLAIIWISLMCVMPIAYISADWFEKKGEPNTDVWQESCNPVVVLKSEMSCQQANYMIKQNAKMLEYMCPLCPNNNKP